MTYSCSRCGRSFSSDEILSFCPFCGEAYAQPSGGAPVGSRIVIGSDSERTVQEKYWNLAHEELSLVLSFMERKVQQATAYQPRQLNADAWLKRLAHCGAAAQFAKCCDSFLSQVSSALFADSCDEKTEVTAFDAEEAANAIKRRCVPLLNALAPGAAAETLPEFVCRAAQSKETPAPAQPAIRQLLQTVDAIKPALYSALNNVGIFSVAAVLRTVSVKDANTVAPEALEKQLLDLSQLDYDPLFGAPVDPFIEAFVQAVAQLANAANHARGWPAYDQNERARRSALNDYFFAWERLLFETLDQVYQSHAADMMIVQRSVQQACLQYCEQEDVGEQGGEKHGEFLSL